MSTLRINNIEAQSVPASPTIDEKVKVTNSSGDILVNIDGKTSGITTIGINTTDGNIKFDANSNVLISGILTATTLAGNFTPDSLEIGSNIKLGNAGVITATSFVGSGANLTGITGTTINNNATTKFITGTNNANELDCEANLSYNNSLVTFASSSLMVSRTTSPTISVKETAGNKEGAFRANTDGVLIRSLGNYPLIFHTNQTERAQIDGSGRFLIGTNSVYNANSYSNNLVIYENGDTGMSILGNNSNSNYSSLYFSDTSTASRAFLEVQLGANGNFTIGTNGSGPIRFTNSGGERLRINSNGAFGLGGANYGTSGQVLKSGGSGAAASWGDAGGLTTEIYAYVTFGATYDANTGYVVHNITSVDSNGITGSTSNERLTPTVAGTYYVIYNCNWLWSFSGGATFYNRITKNGSEQQRSTFAHYDPGSHTNTTIAVMSMNGSSDYVQFEGYENKSGQTATMNHLSRALMFKLRD